VTLAELASSSLVAPYAAVAAAAGAAASPLLRNVGTVGGNLCQHTRCWYYRGAEWHCWLGGGDTCYAQQGDHRKHGLEPGDCISAHPSDLAPALAASGATVEVRGRRRTKELPLLDLYRRPTSDDRSLVVLRPGELVTGVRLPAAPDGSAYERLGERAAFSFPLVAVAAARRGAETRVVAAGVANIPVALDPSDPLAGLKGSPQSAWKRRALTTLVERAVARAA
jgi:xanthine dehydrogenase YagS FAD-binding subunit